MIFSSEACEKTRAICEWLGARHLRSGVRATLVDRGDKFKSWSRSKRLISLRGVVVGLTSEVLPRALEPVQELNLPQRGLWETGKFPTTTGKTSSCHLWFDLLLSYALHCAIYIPRIKLLIHMCMIAYMSCA